MNTKYKIALTMLVGTGLGAAVIEGLHAQAKPPTYVVIAIRKINDADTYKTGVLDKASAVIAAAGGRFVVRTQSITSLDGPPPQRFVLLQFDSVEKANAWHNRMARSRSMQSE